MSREDEDRLPWEDDLSAFLDGELDPEREAALRAELERDPALAARLAALRAVDEGLRGMDAPPVPSDLRARLQARIEAEAGASRPAARAPRRRRRWLSAPALAAAAVAAVVALMLLVRRPGEERPPERIAEERAPAVPEVPVAPSPEGIAPSPEPVAPSPEGVAPPPEPERIAEQPVPAPAPEPAPDAAAPVELADASDEELEVAMDWEVIEDLELIEELDLLEALVARAEQGRS